jgi:membrane protein
MKANAIRLLKQSIIEFNRDNGTLLAASISFNLLLSLFPLAFVAVFGAESITGSKHFQDLVIRGITYLLPVSQNLITSVTGTSVAINKGISAVALVGLIWGGISFFNSVRVSLNIAWGIKNPHSILSAQLINLGMMIGAGILLFLSIILTFMLSSIREPVSQGLIPINHTLTLRILANILITILSFAVFSIIYKYLPNRRSKWKDIWVGALVASIIFEITKLIFVQYVNVFKPYNLAYGSIGTVIAFLIWAYLSALIFLFIAKTMHLHVKRQNTNSVSD